MVNPVTVQSTAPVVAAPGAGRQANHDVEPPSGAPTAPSPVAAEPETEFAVARLRRLRERGLLTAHEFEIALDRVTGTPIS
jgi:hypothetical protein